MSTLIEQIQRRIANRPKGVSMREIGRRASVGEASVRRLRAGKPVTMPVYERVSAALDAIEATPSRAKDATKLCSPAGR